MSRQQYQGSSRPPGPGYGNPRYPPPRGPGGPGPSAPSGSGTQRLITNSFEITTLPRTSYEQYDAFSPQVVIRNKRIQLFHYLQTTVAPQVFNPRAIYDGKAIAYAPAGRLAFPNNGNATFIVKLGTTGPVLPGTPGAYSIKLTSTLSDVIDPRHVLDLINNRRGSDQATVATNLIQMIIRQGPNLRHTNNGRAYFTDHQAKNIGGGLELWRGIFQSVRPSLERMILTIDTCTAAIYESRGPMHGIALQVLGTKNVSDLARLRSTDAKFKKLEAHFRKLKCKVRTGNTQSAIKTIHGLVERGAQYVFPRNDEEISVARHYLEAYGITLTHNDIPGVRLTGKNAPIQVIVPMELVHLEPGQLYRKKLPEEHTREMVRFATMRPKERLTRIQDAVNRYRQSEFVVESGMEVDKTPIGVDARLLRAPDVHFEQSIVPRDGSWNVLDQRLSHPKPLECWGIVDFTDKCDMRAADEIERQICGCCEKLGIPAKRRLFFLRGRGHQVEQSLDALKDHPSLTSAAIVRKLIVVILLPTYASDIKQRVKYWGDVLNGVHTQCFRENKVFGANSQYWNNNILKFNARLGGRNFFSLPTDRQNKTRLFDVPTMVVGVDVGHPSPGDSKPSVVGVVYSHDIYATHYAALTGIQPPRTEGVENMASYIYRAIDGFGAINDGIAPQHLILFRDGLSEGEFDRVALKERKEIQVGIDKIWEDRKPRTPKPLLTYAVVGKRHHAVFFPSDQQTGDRTGNCRPGSLIDKGVTHPFGNDFYLQSHAAIQGTSRSGHYTVLYDEKWNENRQYGQQWDLDEIQKLAYTLCHVYAKATRSVSIPAPVYYADLVCSRGVNHVQPGSQDLLSDSGSVASGSSGPSMPDMDAWRRAFSAVNQHLRYSMYFL